MVQRLSGKAGRNNIGALYMVTDDTDSGIPKNEFGVLRLNRDVGKSSSIGMLFTEREATGSLAGDDDYGRTFAIDGRWGIGEKAEVKGFAAKTKTPGIEKDDHAFYLNGRWNTEKWLGQVSYTEVGDGFNPEVGFLNRKGYRRPEIYALSRHQPKDFLGLREIRPHVYYEGFWDFDDEKESSVFHAGVHWEFKSSHEIHTGFNVFDDNLRVPFEISPGVVIPVGEYSRTEAQLVGYTNQSAPTSIYVTLLIGEFFDGYRATVIPPPCASGGQRSSPRSSPGATTTSICLSVTSTRISPA